MRIVFFLIALVLSATGPWWLTGGVLFLYAAYWRSSEVLGIALIADVFFHQQFAVPAYLLFTAATLLFFIMFTPLLTVYNEK